METKKYHFVLNGKIYGPYSGEEMHRFNLLDDTPVTDDIDSGNWSTAKSFKFVEQDEDADKNKSYTLKLEGALYSFLFKINGKTYGPRSAKQMLKLNLPPDTPVTETSLNGEWFEAGNFDFQSLSLDEEQIRDDARLESGKNVGAGLIWIFIGIVVTAVSYSNAAPGGTYFIASGAIIGGFIQLIRGIIGGGSEKVEYTYEDNDTENKDGWNKEINTDIPLGQLNELYAKLGLTPAATDVEVRKAYRALAKRYHPDRHNAANEEEKRNATVRFRDITEAYELIKQIRKMK